MLKVSELKVYGLAPVSFELEAGDVLVIRGASGSGKSLLLRAIGDLDETSGAILYNGRDKNQFPADDWRRLVRYLAAESGWWRERVEAHFTDLPAAKELAVELSLEEKLFQSPVAYLSSGERQRMAFIRAIEDAPIVLLLDEPTSALDESTAAQMETKISELQKNGVILIIVTHSQEQALRLATKTLILEDGVARLSTS